MGPRILVTALLLVAATALVTTQVVSQEGGGQGMSADEMEMMKKWQAFATPGKAHEHLARKAGDWDLRVTMWQSPGAPPVESTSHSEMKTIMGGRYLVDHTRGSFMGMSFEGMGLSGYDNLKKKYVTLWIDNMGTGLMVSEGSMEGQVCTYVGEGPDVMSGTYKKWRTVETFIDDDTWKTQMYGPGPDDKEFKMMEITYRRAKKST